MRLLVLCGVLFLLVSAGCSDDSAPIVSPGAEPQSQFVQNQGLFLGRIDGTSRTVGRCNDVAYILHVDYTGSGPLSFLGLTKAEGSFCSVWLHPVAPFEGTMSGEGILTAASGDQVVIWIDGSYYCANDPPATMQMWGTYTVTGGTGRFAGATGSGSLYGEQDLQDLMGVHATWFEFNGSLQF